MTGRPGVNITRTSKPRATDPAALWRITRTFWTQPAVEQTCLAWQASFGLDVSFLCWASWAAAKPTIDLVEPDIDQAADVIAGWRSKVLDPVRSARKRIRTTAADLPSAVAGRVHRALRTGELAAERAEQYMLMQWLWDRPERSTHPRADVDQLHVVDAMAAVVRVNGGQFDSGDVRSQLDCMARQFGEVLES